MVATAIGENVIPDGGGDRGGIGREVGGVGGVGVSVDFDLYVVSV